MKNQNRILRTLGVLLVVIAWSGTKASAADPTPGLAPELWLEANEGVTTTAGLVTNWADQSGNGYNFDVTTGATAPTYVASGVNGEPVISFNGLTDSLTSTTGITADTDMTVFMVLENTGTTGNAVYALAAGDNNHGIIAGFASPTDTWNWYNNPTGDLSSIETPIGTESDSAYQVLTSPDGAGGTSGGYFTVGNAQSASVFFDGNVAEVISYNSDLSAADRAEVTDYLDTKYGIAEIPEPSSSALFSIALIFVAMWRLRSMVQKRS